MDIVLKRSALQGRSFSSGLNRNCEAALEWSEQIELSAHPEKNKGRRRPKGNLSEGQKRLALTNEETCK